MNPTDADTRRPRRPFPGRIADVAVRVLVCCACLQSTSALAIPVLGLESSPDITIPRGFGATRDHDVLIDGLDGTYSHTTWPEFEPATDLVAYDRADGEEVFAFDTSQRLPGANGDVWIRGGDVASRTAGIWSLRFDASAFGVTKGARVDAVAFAGSDLLMSFDVSVEIDGILAADEDLLHFDGTGFSLFFDGSAAGFDTRLDLDAVDYAADAPGAGRLFLSFDGSGMHGANRFDADDVLEIEPGSGVSQAAADAGLGFASKAADLVALRVNADSDSDGLSDDDEAAIGTEIDNPDTDGDGLLDGVETDTGVFVDASDTGTDPVVADTDGDGINDGQEVAMGSDPNNGTPPAVPSLRMFPMALLLISLIQSGMSPLRYRRRDGLTAASQTEK